MTLGGTARVKSSIASSSSWFPARSAASEASTSSSWPGGVGDAQVLVEIEPGVHRGAGELGGEAREEGARLAFVDRPHERDIDLALDRVLRLADATQERARVANVRRALQRLPGIDLDAGVAERCLEDPPPVVEAHRARPRRVTPREEPLGGMLRGVRRPSVADVQPAHDGRRPWVSVGDSSAAYPTTAPIPRIMKTLKERTGEPRW